MLMHLPIYLKQDASALPPLGRHNARYIVADNGVFLERRGPVHTTCTRVRKSDLLLEDHHQYCTLSCGKLPAPLHRQMLSFFARAHQIHGGEAALVLLFHPERHSFVWYCPVQTIGVHKSRQGWIASDYIEFDNPIDLPDGFIQLGDAHLHPGAPHPSVTDVVDDQDGLHIIVGDIEQTPEYHIDFVMDQVRFNLAPELFFEDPTCRPLSKPPDTWIDQIRIRVESTSTATKN
jgi:hypothetical protein